MPCAIIDETSDFRASARMPNTIPGPGWEEIQEGTVRTSLYLYHSQDIGGKFKLLTAILLVNPYLAKI